jgi:hypothetical protein
MAGESPEHADICTNLVGELRAQLKGTPCRVRSKDTKVRSGPAPHQPHIIAIMGVLKTAVEAFDGGVTELYPDMHGCILRSRCLGIMLCEIHPFAHESQA